MNDTQTKANKIDTSVPGWDDLDESDEEPIVEPNKSTHPLFRQVPSPKRRFGRRRLRKRVREQDRLSLANFNPDELLLAAEAAQVLGISTKTLANWRWKGNGPSFVKIGGAIRYQVGELKSFIEIRQRTSTSEQPAK